jgi:hypothetical protein
MLNFKLRRACCCSAACWCHLCTCCWASTKYTKFPMGHRLTRKQARRLNGGSKQGQGVYVYMHARTRHASHDRPPAPADSASALTTKLGLQLGHTGGFDLQAFARLSDYSISDWDFTCPLQYDSAYPPDYIKTSKLKASCPTASSHKQVIELSRARRPSTRILRLTDRLLDHSDRLLGRRCPATDPCWSTTRPQQPTTRPRCPTKQVIRLR